MSNHAKNHHLAEDNDFTNFIPPLGGLNFSTFFWKVLN